MTKYIALLDGEPGTYGVSIPDCPGCVAMGDSEQNTVENARAALSQWMQNLVSEKSERPIPSTAETLRNDPQVSAALAAGAIFVVVEAE
jgi:predicted RNase H-like HicB family nuclease